MLHNQPVQQKQGQNIGHLGLQFSCFLAPFSFFCLSYLPKRSSVGPGSAPGAQKLHKSFQNGAPCAPRGSFAWFRRTSVFEQHYYGLAIFTSFTRSPGRPKTPLRTNVATDRLFCLSGLCKKRPMVASFSFLLRK